jgi:molybdopterin-guanine dinucleotide biosynthesis protein A
VFTPKSFGNGPAMSQHSKVAAFILGGGANSRMGCNKGLMEFAGEPLIVRTARLLKPLVARVTVIGPAGPYRGFGLHTVPDRIPGVRRMAAYQGPLAGIVTALGVTSSPWNLILACDLPYLTGEWIVVLLSRAVQSDAHVFMPRSPGGVEPLAAVYRREAYAPLAEAFRKGVRKVTDALVMIPVETIALADLGGLEHNYLALNNMNTPEDFASAKKWWGAREPQKIDGLKSLKPPRPKRSSPRRNK